MPHDHLLCLDIETVPDPELVPADWPADRFVPNPIWHRVVAISFVEARIEQADGRERYPVECCRTGGEAGWDEARLLRAWWRYFARCRARVVTWNGKGFDLPVLRLRAMVHGLSAAPWFQGASRWDGYTQRYAPDWHCDLMEQLSDYGACRNLALQDVALALGLPGKIGGHGAEVAAMVARGEAERVRAYCEADCLNLFALYVRWALLSGRLDAAGHDASLESLVRCLEGQRDRRPHLGEFLDRWRASTRPAPMYLQDPEGGREPIEHARGRCQADAAGQPGELGRADAWAARTDAPAVQGRGPPGSWAGEDGISPGDPRQIPADPARRGPAPLDRGAGGAAAAGQATSTPK